MGQMDTHKTSRLTMPDTNYVLIDVDPMALFCQEFPEKQELHRNMLGLLGNVAEVKELRPQLMTSQFISVFRLVLLSFPFLHWLPGGSELWSLLTCSLIFSSKCHLLSIMWLFILSTSINGPLVVIS